MQPYKKASLLTKIGWLFVCIFLAFIAVGLFNEIEIEQERQDTKKENRQHYENNAAYIVWFQQNNELFHKRLDALEEASKEGSPPADERDALRAVMSRAITYKVSSNSDFYYIHQDYIKAFKKMNDAFLFATWQEEYKEKMDQGKQMETEAVEEFIHQKEESRENY